MKYNDYCIRKASEPDYDGIVSIYNILHPDRPTNRAVLQQTDERLGDTVPWNRFVVAKGADLVGYAFYVQTQLHGFLTCKFTINIIPECQRQGLGNFILRHILSEIRPLNPEKLLAIAYEKPAGGIPFLLKHGFNEVFRERTCVLKPAHFEVAPFQAALDRLKQEGIEIVTLQDFEDDSPLVRLYELEHQAMLDIPGVSEDKLGWPEFKAWQDDLLGDPNFRRDMYFIARHAHDIVGLSIMTPDPVTDAAYQWLTGVNRNWRRKHIALALKVSGILYAKSKNYSLIHNSTSVANKPILALNEKLGFEPDYEWVEMEKQFRNT